MFANKSQNTNVGDKSTVVQIQGNDASVTIINNDELAMQAFNAMKAQVEILTLNGQEKSQTIKSQQETIASLVQQKLQPDNVFDVDGALRDITQNDLSKADAILAAVIDKDELAIADTAKRYRQRASLWFSTDTDKAISQYQRATELAPDNAEGWNQCELTAA
jgi:hypothetical protein